MGANRRHHFVPQFYLRRFTAGRPYISCFNKARGERIDFAPIKGQCQIPRYYDWNPDVEGALCEIESAASALLKRIEATKDLASLTSDDWLILVIFVAIQSARVKVTGDNSNEMKDYFAKIYLRGAPELKNIDLDSIKIKEKFPTALPIDAMIRSADSFLSLKAAILENRTPIPFFCTDNPIIKYNSQGRNVRSNGVIGLNSPGLQVIYPISHRLALYLFDPESYKNPSNTGLRVISHTDAARIAMLQYLWSDENLYFDCDINSEFLNIIHNQLSPLRKWRRISIVETEETEKSDGSRSQLVIHFEPQAPIELTFDFAKIKRPFDHDLIGRSDRRRREPPKADEVWVRYEAKRTKPEPLMPLSAADRIARNVVKAGL